MLKLKVQRGAFSQILRDRIQSFRSGDIKIVLSIQPGNEWWYYQEWGTATHATSPDAPSTARQGYVIVPVAAKSLSFPGAEGDRVFAKRVFHKGVPPLGYIRSVLQDIRTQVADDVAHALVESNFDRAALKDMLIGATMPKAQEMIARSMEEKLGQTRPDGKLENANPADVFRQETFIQDFSFD